MRLLIFTALLSLISVTTAGPEPVVYKYDAAGRLTSVVTTFDQWGGNGLVYRYDNAGNILGKTVEYVCFVDRDAVLAAVADWPNTSITGLVVTANLPCDQ